MAVLQVRSRKLRKSSYKIEVMEQMPEVRPGLRLCDRQQTYMLLSTWVIGSAPSATVQIYTVWDAVWAIETHPPLGGSPRKF